jgi:hypothetical protein
MSDSSGRDLERHLLARIMEAANAEATAVANSGIAAAVPHHTLFHGLAMLDHLDLLHRAAQRAKRYRASS